MSSPEIHYSRRVVVMCNKSNDEGRTLAARWIFARYENLLRSSLQNILSLLLNRKTFSPSEQPVDTCSLLVVFPFFFLPETISYRVEGYDVRLARPTIPLYAWRNDPARRYFVKPRLRGWKRRANIARAIFNFNLQERTLIRACRADVWRNRSTSEINSRASRHFDRRDTTAK